MKRPPDLYRTAVGAYRELTASGDEASATRARVLAAASCHAGSGRRPVSLLVGTALVAIASASLATPTLAGHWRKPPASTIAWTPAADLPAFPGGRRRGAVIPPRPAEPDRPPPDDRRDEEAAAYGRAHQIHFAGHTPARALAAWDAYLARYPRGTFAPEARYNRALCLIWLGRFSQAEAALGPFLDEPLGGYRRAEAAQLLDWLRARSALP